jgi:2-oxoisovalerate dehydrogenase E1 component
MTAKMLTPVDGNFDEMESVLTVMLSPYHTCMFHPPGIDTPTAEYPITPSVHELTPDRLRSMYRTILLPRLIEEKMLILLRQGKLSKWFSGIGQEAVAAGVVSALEPDDYVLPMHRNLGVFTGRDLDLPTLFRQLLGKAGGYTGGRDRTFHFGVLRHHVVGMISHLGAMMPVADGLALAAQLKGTRQVVATFVGDGATSEGDFHEAANLAAVWNLPVIIVVENNHYGLSTPTTEQYACTDLAERAVGYGMSGAVVDGNDYLAVYEAVRAAADRARRGDGPSLLEFKTFRMRGHEEASGTAYVPRELFDEWGKKDPVLRFEGFLIEQGLFTSESARAVRAELKQQIDALVEDALAAPEPDSTPERELADVYEPSAVSKTPELPREGPERRYVDAISDGLREAMRRNDRVVLMGQDVAEYGGVFKVTEGFVEEFGKARVRNTPIVESAAVGAALGLALEGFRPIVEMQFGDFITCAFNQIVNNVAKTKYRWAEPVPMMIRAPIGGGTGAGPFHSQNVEAWFTHVAGLKVVAPATPYDAKGLLLAALEDGNPVLYLEHKLLYRSARGPVPDGYYMIPIGRARVARAGRHLTIVTYGVGVVWALDAAEHLATDGHELEVVDLRSLLPWDRETVFESVRRTNRVLVLHEAPLTGGFGGELASTIGEEMFDDLDAPVMRLGGLDIPVPFSKALEDIYMPKRRLVETIEKLLEY